MARFIVAQDVAQLLPKMQVVIVVAYGLDNSGTNTEVNKFAEVCGLAIRTIHEYTLTLIAQDVASTTLSTLSAYPNAQSHPRIALYRDTLKEKCNLSAKKFPQSNESLYKRLLKEKKALPPINPIVDFYNSVSIKHGVTAGAFDLVDLQSRSEDPLELRMSSSTDKFKALGTEASAEPISVGVGELVYAQGTTVLTRHLAWRQATQALVTEKSRGVIFMSEVFNEQDAAEPTDMTRSVAKDLVEGLHRFFGVNAEAIILGRGIEKLSLEINAA